MTWHERQVTEFPPPAADPLNNKWLLVFPCNVEIKMLVTPNLSRSSFQREAHLWGAGTLPLSRQVKQSRKVGLPQ